MRSNGATPDDADGVVWWNLLSEWGRHYWMERAGGTGRPVDAWTVFKRDVGADLQCLHLMVDAAFRGDHDAALRLRDLGASLLESGGVGVLAEVQGVLHDWALYRRHPSNESGRISTFWEHLPQWGAV